MIDTIENRIKKIRIDATINGWMPNEKVNFILADNEKTASWTYMPPHKIRVGRHNEKEDDYILESLICHELSHGLNTSKDLVGIAKKCQELKVPFNLFNLLEDVRIEYLFRETYNREFLWKQSVLYAPKEILGPEALMYALKVTENNKDEIDKLLKQSYSFDATRVLSYYEQIIKTATTEDIIPIALQWVKEFHTNEQQSPLSFEFGDNGDGEGTPLDPADLTDSELQELAEKIKEMLEKASKKGTAKDMDTKEESIQKSKDKNSNEKNLDGEDVDENGNPLDDSDSVEQDDDNNDSSKQQEHDLKKAKQRLNGDNEAKRMLLDLNVAENFIYDKKEVDKLSKEFTKILKPKENYINTISPSKRFSVKNMVLDKDNIYRQRKVDFKQETFLLILDCSGSMSGSHLTAGKSLILILNKLAKKRLITGSVILTSSEGFVEIPLPIQDVVIKAISAGGDEGFSRTIKHNQKALTSADKVFVFTDAEIVCPPDFDFNKKYGIFTYGMYVGKQNQYDQLLKYFNVGISKDNLADVVYELVKRIKKNYK